jgi:hypothetical protein
MINKHNNWPAYGSPLEMLKAETSSWGPRLEVAEARHSLLEGELPPELSSVFIGIVDGHTERPEHFSLLDIYSRQNLNPDKTGVLLSINFESGATPPENAHNLADQIAEQAKQMSLPVATSLMGYSEKRRIDTLKSDTWDIAVAHALRWRINYPVVGVSNDADMESASEDYSTKMTQNDQVGRVARIWGSEVAFSQPGGPELPLHKLVAYVNGGRQLIKAFIGRPVMYGASMGLTLESYMGGGGWAKGPFPNTYGIGEPSRLVHNTWARLTGKEIDPDDLEQAYQTCARRVGGLAVVSPRREIMAYATQLGEDVDLAANLDTEPTNPYRAMGDAEIAALADSVSIDNPAFLDELDKLDQSYLKLVPEKLRPQAQIARKALRERLELPPSSQK